MALRYGWSFVLVIASLVVGGPATAANAVVVPAFDTGKVMVEQRQIRSDAESKAGRYKYLSSDERSQLFTAQSRLFALIESRSYDELNSEQRLQAFNELESISAIVNNEDDDRMVCERVKTVGSNRVDRVCMTVAQREYERERARDNLRRNSTLER